ncbi:MAG TPA: TRAFs-binding domain-containing protein [Allocoleopsis sp.]
MRRTLLHLSSEKPLNYKPEPIDTSNVTLSAEHQKLTELLAKNIHELWVQQRFAEGWEYGRQQDDIRKNHPCLVPYEELPDTEKQSHRLTVLGIIKTLLALGYRIEGNNTTFQNSASVEDQDIALVLETLKSSSELNLSSLLALKRETIKLQPRTPEIYQVIGDAILQLGEPLMAYDVLTEGLKHWSNNLRLQQLLALSLARSGATQPANSLLVKLLESGHSDEETLGLLARTHKDLWIQATDSEERTRQLGLAASRYEQAYQCSGSVWTGINAATMAMLMGQEDHARKLARAVRQQCLQQLKPDSERRSDEYWLLATLGEAALILREWTEAQDWYAQAVQVGERRFGDLSSSRRNATLLVQYLEGGSERIKQWFPVPRVVVFSGHMIDQRSRPTPRFPPSLESKVYQAIRDRLYQLDARLGYASAACGSDILFLEAILELKGEAHILLPYDREQFTKDAVDITPDGNWVERFDRVTQKATKVIVASNHQQQEGEVLYEYTNRLLHGLAKMRAEQLDTEVIPLAVWNGKPSNDPGGTASAIKHWQQWGDEVEVIDLESILEHESLNLSMGGEERLDEGAIASGSTPGTPAPEFSRQILALLFADVVKYSHLTEEQLFPFMQHFLGAVADLIARSVYQPMMRNTWGDALYFVFSDVQQAGHCALELCDFIQSTDWSAKGLPKDLSLRIALHAGPVYRHINPITGHTDYIGTHVSHTARIEPIAPPGKVYASQAFAAIAASEGVSDFTCDYVGQTPLAKEYGTFPTYHVRRRQLYFSEQ